ncbi:MAG TPA: hypothetical protein VFO89_15420, partial [Thermoanaerobaculia bacterium]|nr:hypothetical protein [Thermoanaerobaculia bacterium]
MLVLAASIPLWAADPATVAVSVTGDPVPGATITAKATITINDGSALQSIKWTQTGGAHVTLSNATTETVTIVLPAKESFKEHLIEILEEAPLPEANYPPHIPVREFYGGLQNRFGVIGMSPHATGDAAAIRFEIEVATSSGTYKLPATVNAKLPWRPSIG